jgi:myo-inositol-1(or 4)-monophosphatase
MVDLDHLLKVALDAAGAASAEILKSWHQPQSVTAATAHDIKLELDTRVQHLMMGIIHKTFPDHHVHGEEFDQSHGEDDVYTWVIDPVDGTANLAFGLPIFCISIACRYERKTVVGIIADPLRNEVFSAINGRGAFCNQQPIQVSERSKLSEVMLLAGGLDRDGERTVKFAQKVCKVRVLGSLALSMAYVAAGRADMMLYKGTNDWDMAAGDLLIREAGGKIDLTPMGNNKFDLCAWNGKFEVVKD